MKNILLSLSLFILLCSTSSLSVKANDEYSAIDYSQINKQEEIFDKSSDITPSNKNTIQNENDMDSANNKTQNDEPESKPNINPQPSLKSQPEENTPTEADNEKIKTNEPTPRTKYGLMKGSKFESKNEELTKYGLPQGSKFHDKTNPEKTRYGLMEGSKFGSKNQETKYGLPEDEINKNKSKYGLSKVTNYGSKYHQKNTDPIRNTKKNQNMGCKKPQDITRKMTSPNQNTD
jgi:hypothetical protein